MTSKEIKIFQEIVGPKADYMLFGDNANNFKNLDGDILIDENSELLYFISGAPNTLEKQDKPVEFQMCNTEMIQYCQARLSISEARNVLKLLKDKGLLDNNRYAEISKDKLFFGLREKTAIEPEIIR